MSTINPNYTFNYSQPDDYRLSHDSVFLAWEVFNLTKNLDLKGKRVLDVCAGSGIVGMDFLFHRRAQGLSLPDCADFLEIQEVYQEHFFENIKRLGSLSTELHFLNINYDILETEKFFKQYDIIIGNPPYFLPTQGKKSDNEFKNRCRFFLDSGLTNLINAVCCSLKTNCSAYLLLREQTQHGWDILSYVSQLAVDRLQVSLVNKIRGTYLVQLTKL